ncbi:response regulator [Paludibaculum fermentans]|uniref:response regulator n=1 Tax=Paludibaculum fermentans TaxID=1473598 RepID=UPI003EBAE666
MPKILVIDDSPSVLEAIQAMLQAHGFEVLIHSRSATAFQRLQEEAVDLIVTDIYMPDADGLEVIRARRSVCPGVPIVAMSGMSGPRDMLKVARLMGACQTLRKPFTKEQLLAAIDAALEGSLQKS